MFKVGLIFIFSLSLCPAFTTQPLDTCRCEEWHQQYVDVCPACPNNQTVHVSHTGAGDDLTFDEFWDHLGRHDSVTYIIRQSTTPYVVGCRQVNIGGWDISNKRTCIVVKGETGNRQDVVLVGADPASDPNFWKSSEYNGPSSCGIGQVIQMVNCEHIVIADLTMRNFAGKMLKVDGGNTGGQEWCPTDVRFHNLDLWDCGSQMIKGAGNPIGARRGILECSYLHYTTGLFPESSYETQGIDIHEGRDWIIRDNVFENFRQEPNKPGLGSAILMWDDCDSVLAERNIIINCNFAIKFGASWDNLGSDVMLARNNLIIYDETSTQWNGDNVFEVGQSVSTGGIFHNTVWNPTGDAANAFTVCSNNYRIENNLYVKGTTHRCASQTNNSVVDASWFQNVGAYDFRLAANHTVPTIPDVTDDIFGNQRPGTPSAGAFEFAPVGVKRETESGGSWVPVSAPLGSTLRGRVIDVMGNRVNHEAMGQNGVYFVVFDGRKPERIVIIR